MNTFIYMVTEIRQLISAYILCTSIIKQTQIKQNLKSMETKVAKVPNKSIFHHGTLWGSPQNYFVSWHTYLLAIQTLIKNNSHTPDVNLGWDFWRVLSDHKTFWGKVPVGASSLRGQVHSMVRVIVLLIHYFTQSKVCYFYFTTNIPFC